MSFTYNLKRDIHTNILTVTINNLSLQKTKLYLHRFKFIPSSYI